MAVQSTSTDSLAEGMGTDVATKKRRAAPSRTRFLVVWWMSKNPYAAVFEDRVAAEAAANVRNAILVTFKGSNAEVETVVDWYRRDEEGRPMPAEWRELMGEGCLPLAGQAHPEAWGIEAASSSLDAPGGA